MKLTSMHLKLFLLLATLLLSLQACSNQSEISDKTFVGKWKSTRSNTPIHMYENGEWEIKNEDGVILQYGIWEYKSHSIIWSFKVDSSVVHDANAVLSTSPTGFSLKEQDGTVTTFSRLDTQ